LGGAGQVKKGKKDQNPASRPMVGQDIFFGPFRLLAEQRLLLEGDQPVRLGSRAFDILAALVERPGAVIGKDELKSRTWPKTVVEDANLKIQVSALRRALGDGQGGRRYIATIPGRGYNFVAPVRFEEPPQAPLPATIVLAAAHNLPLAATRMIGRDEAVATLVSRLSRERLLTIVGPGGIGKTTLALAVAESMIADYEHGVWLVDLSPLGDPRLVPSTVATVLGLEIHTESPLPGLVAALRDRRMLLLLDNCEHVIDAAASLATAVLTGVPGVNILATSREPLGVAGEREHRLGPLGSPPTSSGLTAAEAATFPAVQLFVERVTEIVEDFVLTDANALLIAEICRRLDGLPLAIEFAAPRVAVLGLEGLATHLDGGLPLLRARRRMAVPRHRTMQAVIDWSYSLLNAADQRFFQALGIFAGGFTVDATAAVASDSTTRVDAIAFLADLVAKSLVVADVSGAEPRFGLLDTTRAYAIEKLHESGERDRIARRHAEYYHDLFERAESEAAAPLPNGSLADYAEEIDNLCTALDWTSSSSGIPEIAVALTVAAIPLWLHLSLFEECHQRVDYALSNIAVDTAETVRPRMRLCTALATSLFYTRGAIAEVKSAWEDALGLAQRLNETDYQLRALWGLWSYSISAGDYREADQRGRHFHQIASCSNNTGDLLIAQRMIGGTLHFLGDQTAARLHIEAMLSQYVESLHRPNIIRFHYDQRLAAQVTLARILWAQGLPEQARRAATQAVDQAKTSQQPISLCFALNEAAIPVALFTGDWTSAEPYLATLHTLSERYDFAVLRARAVGSKGVLAAKRGDPRTGVRMIRDALHELDKGGYHAYPLLLGSLAEALRTLGDIEGGGLACVDAALTRCERTGERWYIADLLRIKGELTLKSSDPEAPFRAAAEFSSSLERARQQGALSWELRAATSFARLLRDQGRPADAIACLQPVYDRFTEGFGTADFIAATQLLDELGNAHHD
jgi:predicted ATPase/DNA-binding winged helix-turn-helix (wHTH) protein